MEERESNMINSINNKNREEWITGSSDLIYTRHLYDNGGQHDKSQDEKENSSKLFMACNKIPIEHDVQLVFY